MSNAGELWILRAATSTEKCGRRRRERAPSRRARRPRWPPGSCPCAGSRFRGDGVLSPRRDERRRRGGGDGVERRDAGLRAAELHRRLRREAPAGPRRRPRRETLAGLRCGLRGERAPTPAAARAVGVARPRDRGAAYRRARGSRSPSCPKGQSRAGPHDPAPRHRSPRARAWQAGGGGRRDAAAEAPAAVLRRSGAARGRELRRPGADEKQAARVRELRRRGAPRESPRSGVPRVRPDARARSTAAWVAGSSGRRGGRGRVAGSSGPEAAPRVGRHARGRAGRCARGAGDGIQQGP